MGGVRGEGILKQNNPSPKPKTEAFKVTVCREQQIFQGGMEHESGGGVGVMRLSSYTRRDLLHGVLRNADFVRILGRILGRAGPQQEAWNNRPDREERFRARLGVVRAEPRQTQHGQ